jgi:hypothetical protein
MGPHFQRPPASDSGVHEPRGRGRACPNETAHVARARAPSPPSYPLWRREMGNDAPVPGKAHKSALEWAPPPHPLSLARACSTLPASACLPLSSPLLCSPPLSHLLSASLLILRPLPLNKKRLFLTRALSSDPFLQAPGCLLRTRAPAERSGGAEPAPAPADLRSRRGRFASVR